jgi:tetratricopeptide (TPR) repeat protein
MRFHCISQNPGRAIVLIISAMLIAVPPSPAQKTPSQNELNSRLANAVAALKSGDLDTAERILTDALRGGVRSALVFHNLGVIAQERDDHSLAITRFREAIQLQPDYGPARLLLGSSLLATGKRQEALSELRRAARLMPQEPAVHLELAKAYESAGNWLEAVPERQKLGSLAPDNAEYSYRLGKDLAELSVWCLQEIRRTNPDSARLHQALGQEYALQGKYEQALAAYEQAARSDPKMPELHLGLALMLLRLNRFDEALQQVKIELSLVPESKIAADTKARILAAKASGNP